MHLGDGAPWQGEVLERGLADDQVEGLVGEGHLGHVALAEFDLDPGPAGVLGGDLDEGAADVEAGHLEASEPGDLDRQVSRSGRDLEHPCAWEEARGQLRSLLPVRLELALRAPDARVPPRDRTFHLGSLESPALGFGHLHLDTPYLTLLVASLQITPNNVRIASITTRSRGESPP